MTRTTKQSRRRIARLLVCSALLSSFGVMGVPDARAFTPSVSEYYSTTRWPTTSPVTWNFASNFPGGDYRARIADGFASWNTLGQSLQFSGPGADVSPTGSNSCFTSTRRAILWAPLIGNTAGTAWSCSVTQIVNGQVITSGYKNFEITFDSDGQPYGWWTGYGDIPWPPPYIADLWSVASHEIGHVAGQKFGGDGAGHFFNSDPHVCPAPLDSNYLERETMCQSVYTNSRVQRNPDDHDIHLFNGAY